MSNINTNTNASILDEKLALVTVAISVPGGYRRLTTDQIAALGGSLPDSKVVTEGSLKVFNSDAFAPFLAIRRTLFRLLQKCGIKALGSSKVFAIPRVKLESILTEVAAAEGKFKTETADLDANYESIYEAHIAKNPEAETLIRAKRFARVDVISRLSFSHAVFCIQPVVREGEDADKGVESIVSGLARQLFEEIAGEMATLSESDTFTKNGRGVQRTLRPLRAAVEKLEGLDFLDPLTIAGAVKMFNTVLSGMPVEGYIDGEEFKILRRLVVDITSDPDELVNAASKVANGVEVKEVLFPTPVVPVAAPDVAAHSVETPPVVVASEKIGAVPADVPSLPSFGTGLPPLPQMPRAAPVLPVMNQMASMF